MTPSIVRLLAHEGHGMTSPESLFHILEPIHAVWVVAFVLLLAAARFAWRLRTETKQVAAQHRSQPDH